MSGRLARVAAASFFALAASGPAARGQTVVELDSPMVYLANAQDPGVGTAWVEPGFDDSGWTSGAYGVGYETETGPFNASELLRTTVPAATSSVYTRATFVVDDLASVTRLTLGVDYDDGYVAWINGVEVLRAPEMPEGEPGWDARPAGHESSNALAPVYDPIQDVSAAGIPALVEGENVLAIGVWNAATTSSDLVLVPRLAINEPTAVSRGPYLQLGTPASVVVRWRTNVPTAGRVRYGDSPLNLTQSVDDGATSEEHEVALVGLSPDTTYYYSVGTPAETLAGGDADHFFLTAPAPGTSRRTRLWVLGDSGTKNADAAAVRDAYYAFTAGVHTDLWLMLGDNAYPDGTDLDYQAAVFHMYPEVLRRSVLWPTFGNHEGITADSATQTGPYYDLFTLPRAGEAGGVASGTEAYYSFDFGDLHFVCLNSHDLDRSAGGAMMTWLEEDLLQNDLPWVIAFWHHPPYSKGSHDSDTEQQLVEMRENALPVLEGGGVDLVLAGHSHSYERSFLLDAHYGRSDTLEPGMIRDGGDGRPEGSGAYHKPACASTPHAGAVYQVAGSSGQTSGGSLDHPAMYLSVNGLGSVVLDVEGLALNATFLGRDGAVLDSFTVIKDLDCGVPQERPDLVVSALSAPRSGTAGGTVTVTDTTKDQGPGGAGASETSFYLSTDTALDAADTRLGGRAVPDLAAGEESTASTPLTIPSGTAGGTYYIVAEADGGHALEETAEENNTASARITISASLPDLTVTSLSAPSSAAAGATIQVTDTTKNRGSASAGASTTRLYLSTNTVVDSGDTTLGDRSVPALGASQTSSGTTSVTIPAGTAPGAYYIIAKADAPGAIAESRETNNTKSRSITVN